MNCSTAPRQLGDVYTVCGSSYANRRHMRSGHREFEVRARAPLRIVKVHARQRVTGPLR